MKLKDLTKPQFDAALAAGRCIAQGNPNNADDRLAFRKAKDALVALLPAGTDATDIVSQAIHWDMTNSVAELFASLPVDGIVVAVLRTVEDDK